MFYSFSRCSALKLKFNECELMPIYENRLTESQNVPVKPTCALKTLNVKIQLEVTL